jgi:hypothetical protein
MLNQEVSEQLTKVLRTDQHLLACADQALEIARMQADVEEVTDEKVNDGISHYRAEVVNLLKMANPEQEGFSFSCCEAQLDEVQLAYDAIKADLLLAGAELRIPIPVMIDILEQNSRIRRIPRQMVKAMHHLSELSMITDVRVSESESESDDEVEKIAQDSSLTEQK